MLLLDWVIVSPFNIRLSALPYPMSKAQNTYGLDCRYLCNRSVNHEGQFTTEQRTLDHCSRMLHTRLNLLNALLKVVSEFLEERHLFFSAFSCMWWSKREERGAWRLIRSVCSANAWQRERRETRAVRSERGQLGDTHDPLCDEHGLLHSSRSRCGAIDMAYKEGLG